MKHHALSAPNGPAICGMGQGRTMYARFRGTPIDQLATVLDLDALITCKRCRERVRDRFPVWFDVDKLKLIPR